MASAEESKAGPEVRLVSFEGEVLTVTLKEARMSETVASMVDDDDDEIEDVPLVNVKTESLRRIVDYMKHHVDLPAKHIRTPLNTAELETVVSAWDAKFVELPMSELFDLLLAAHFMLITPLVSLCCAKLATALHGKSEETLRKFFAIENDFSLEEEQQLRAANPWAYNDPMPAVTATTPAPAK